MNIFHVFNQFLIYLHHHSQDNKYFPIPQFPPAPWQSIFPSDLHPQATTDLFTVTVDQFAFFSGTIIQYAPNFALLLSLGMILRLLYVIVCINSVFLFAAKS